MLPPAQAPAVVLPQAQAAAVVPVPLQAPNLMPLVDRGILFFLPCIVLSLL